MILLLWWVKKLIKHFSGMRYRKPLQRMNLILWVIPKNELQMIEATEDTVFHNHTYFLIPFIYLSMLSTYSSPGTFLKKVATAGLHFSVLTFPYHVVKATPVISLPPISFALSLHFTCGLPHGFYFQINLCTVLTNSFSLIFINYHPVILLHMFQSHHSLTCQHSEN